MFLLLNLLCFYSKLLTMCYKFIDKTDIFTKKNRKERQSTGAF